MQKQLVLEHEKFGQSTIVASITSSNCSDWFSGWTDWFFFFHWIDQIDCGNWYHVETTHVATHNCLTQETVSLHTLHQLAIKQSTKTAQSQSLVMKARALKSMCFLQVFTKGSSTHCPASAPTQSGLRVGGYPQSGSGWVPRGLFKSDK